MKSLKTWLLKEENFDTFQDYLHSKKITFEQLLKKLTSNQPDGIGGNAKFYKIPGTEFGIRIVSGSWRASDNEPLKLIAAHDPFDGENFGQPVAHYGKNIQVLRLQHGSPAGKPFGYDRKDSQAEERAVQSFRQRILEAASFPDSAYELLLSQIIQINEKGYVLDASKSGNLMIDPVSKQFKIVDLNKSESNFKNNSGHIILMLINNFFFNKHQFYLEPEVIKAGQEIINKIERASIKTGLPIEKSSGVDHSYDLVSGNYKPYVPSVKDNSVNNNDVW